MMLVRNLFTFLFMVFLVSCSSVSTNPTSLEGTQWRLNTIQSMDDSHYSPVENTAYTLEFLADQRILVQADCNHGIGTWVQDGASLQIGPVGMTRMYCGQQSLEVRFLRDLDYVRSFVMRRNKLFLATLADGAILEFSALAEEADAPMTLTYQCALSGEVVVSFNNDSNPPTAVLRMGTQWLPLRQVRAASGARYQNAGFEFWEKGGEAHFTSPRGAENCALY